MAPHRDVAAFAELRSLFRSLRPDIVHTHNPKPGVYGRLAARTARVPAIVNTVHGLYATRDDGRAKRAVVYSLERIAATASHAELVQNPEDIPVLRRLGIPATKLTVLGNGVDLTRFRPGRLDAVRRTELRAEWGAGPDDVVCGVVGRLVWEKGYRELFDAAARLRDRVPNLRFVVVGGLDEAKTDQLGASDLAAVEHRAAITFLGLRDDVEDLYGAMDLYVLASHREGYPRSAMEAAATGLPVIATDIRGCRQVVEPGGTGLLVPPRNAPRAGRGRRHAGDRRRAPGPDGRRRAREGPSRVRRPAPDRDHARDLRPAVGTAPIMTTATSVRPARPDDLTRVAALHAERIAEGFLSSLGVPFLRRLYRRVLAGPDSFVLVATGADATVVGFVAGGGDLGALYRRFLLRDGVVAATRAAPRLVRALPRVLETLRYPTATAELPAAEILAVAVDRGASGRGTGRALVDAACVEFRARGIHAARVVTTADNDRALAMYRACGFGPAARLEVHAGRDSEVLVWTDS